MKPHFLQRILIFFYAVLQRTGILEQPWFSRHVYLPLYFIYKQSSEDGLARLARLYPEFFNAGHLIDVGANIGYTTTVLARHLTAGYQVHSFEPDPKNFELLKYITQKNTPAGQVKLISSIVGEQTGQARLWINNNNPADHRVLNKHLQETVGESANYVKVPSVRLDDYAAQEKILANIVFVKIDVQGWESAVLSGMDAIISHNPNIKIWLEYSPASARSLGISPDAALDFLRSRNFAIYRISNDGKLSDFSPHPELDYEDVLCQRKT